MTNEQKQAIITLREAGIGYGSVAKKLNLSEAAVKSLCRRIEIVSGAAQCLHCGASLPVASTGRKRRFCSDKCRMAWWHQNRLTWTGVCAGCGKSFSSDRERKYCSHACYTRSRFGGREQA